MQLKLDGRVAMVAAASKGIGFAIAQALISEGARVSICARTSVSLDTALATLGPNARGTIADVSDAADLERWHQETIESLGHPAILVTNTGGPPAGGLATMTDEQWQSGFDSTLMNIIRLTRLVTPSMQAAKWGRIVHITSLVARDPNPILPISSTLRAGIMALTRLQAQELGPFGITVNGILPGHTMTDRQTHLAEIRAEREGISVVEALASQAKAVPIGRLADAAEIAAPTVFLCSEPASYVTGVSLVVDGGISRGLG